MLSWITENLGTILITLVLLVIVGAIVATLLKNRKKGKSSCGCGCAHCAMHGQCHPQAKK